jgi:uncharacterized protein
MNAHLRKKHDRLAALIGKMGRVCVAFSGGVDSALLLKICLDTLGTDEVIAVTATSDIHPEGEANAAAELARSLGARHFLLASHEMEDPDFVKNDGDRCYHCKKRFMTELAALAREEGFAVVCDGTNADDENDYRPGRRALEELGVRSPLAEAGIGKDEVRALSRDIGVPAWDRPANPCLASRIPYGTPITLERLAAVAKAEAFIVSLGFPGVRVRHHGAIARIEVPVPDMARLLDGEIGERIESFLRGLGFTWVALDLGGYRTGSLNRALGGKESKG